MARKKRKKGNDLAICPEGVGVVAEACSPVEEVIIPEPYFEGGIHDNGDGTVDIVFRWEEIKTEDAEFEVIETKQLPSPKKEES